MPASNTRLSGLLRKTVMCAEPLIGGALWIFLGRWIPVTRQPRKKRKSRSLNADDRSAVLTSCKFARRVRLPLVARQNLKPNSFPSVSARSGRGTSMSYLESGSSSGNRLPGGLCTRTTGANPDGGA